MSEQTRFKEGDYITVTMKYRDLVTYTGEVLLVHETIVGPEYSMMLVNGTQFTTCVDEVRSIEIVPLDGRVLATIERGQDDYLMFVAEPGQHSRWLVPHPSSYQWQRPLMTTPALAIEYLFNAYPDVVLLSRKSYDREVERRKQ